MHKIIVRTSEIKDFKKCQFKWFLRWRKGLFPVHGDATALQFGNWIHRGLELWRNGVENTPQAGFLGAIEETNALNPTLEAKLAMYIGMGTYILSEYERIFGREKIEVLGTEIPLKYPFAITAEEEVTLHMKLDLVLRDEHGLIWIRDYKTCARWSDHWLADDQTSVYLVFAQAALVKAGILSSGDRIHGMQYDFLRKVPPDERPRNSRGKFLNKDGKVSARQGSDVVRRRPIVRTRNSLRLVWPRLAADISRVAASTLLAREGELEGKVSKNATPFCSTMCEYFNICQAHEEGIDIRDMLASDFYRADPYDYDER